MRNEIQQPLDVIENRLKRTIWDRTFLQAWQPLWTNRIELTHSCSTRVYQTQKKIIIIIVQEKINKNRSLKWIYDIIPTILTCKWDEKSFFSVGTFEGGKVQKLRLFTFDTETIEWQDERSRFFFLFSSFFLWTAGSTQHFQYHGWYCERVSYTHLMIISIVIAFIHTIMMLRYVFVMSVIGNLSENKRGTLSHNHAVDFIINRSQTMLRLNAMYVCIQSCFYFFQFWHILHRWLSNETHSEFIAENCEAINPSPVSSLTCQRGFMARCRRQR